MKEKMVNYGDAYDVIIESADTNCVICIASVINEGFLLLHHGLNKLPCKGDNGKIVFERDKRKGHWQYYPSKKINEIK